MIPVQDPSLAIPLTVSIDHDDAEDPHTAMDGQWTLHQFSRRKTHFTDPDTFGLEQADDGSITSTDADLAAKLANGLAFIVSYYEHGRCSWSVRGTGPQCRFDNVGTAGLVIWENDPSDMGATTIEDRQKDAAAFLETYTAWCNGDVYAFSIDDPEGDIDESCGGFYGNDTAYMLTCIKDACGERPVIFKGDASDIGDEYKGRTHDGDDD